MDNSDKYQKIETTKIDLDGLFKRKYPLSMNKFPHDKDLRYLGFVCLTCGYIVDMPTKANKIDENDIYGNRWAIVNAIRVISEHLVEKEHPLVKQHELKVSFRSNRES